MHMASEIKLLVSKNFLNILSKSYESSGYIAGLQNGPEVYCLCASLSKEHFLPGLEVLGIFCFIDSEEDPTSIIKEKLSLFKVELESPMILFVCKENDSFVLKGSMLSCGTLRNVETSFFTQNPTLLLRVTGQLPLTIEVSSDPDTLKENIEVVFEELQGIVQNCALLLKNNGFILTRNKDLYQDASMLKRKRKFQSLGKKVDLDFQMLIQTTGDIAVNHSLVIHCQRREYKSVFLKLPLDVVVASLESSSSNKLYHLVVQALQKQINEMFHCLLQHVNKSEFVCPVPYHFYPNNWDVPFTVVYASETTDAELEPYRRRLHKALLLPIDRPILRKSNKWDTEEDASYLINPHEAITSSGVIGSKSAIVYGRYTYHHYMQDHVDDNGWGCAYRSLQTIVSWYKFQGYTERSVPTHLEIQQALVEIGDKPKSFIGSKKWIGSQEVSFCLDVLLKVESKILCVSNGAEMANKGRELLLHFQEQGTPVMIGGGVLAHTIIGVDFNDNSGEVRFLILDPHYTGGEDLNTIINKGWCGWKGTQFWDKNAFYNLCLPQRPLQI